MFVAHPIPHSMPRLYAPRSPLVLLLLSLMAIMPMLRERLIPLVPAVPAPATPMIDFGKLPLSFVPNAGQSDPDVKFQARGMGGTLFFTPGEIVLSLPLPGVGDPPAPNLPATLRNPHDPRHPAITPSVSPAQNAVVRLQFAGANPTPQVSGVERQPGIVNYFIGNDPAKWRANVPTYAGVVYEQLYPGIDLRYDGAPGDQP